MTIPTQEAADAEAFVPDGAAVLLPEDFAPLQPETRRVKAVRAERNRADTFCLCMGIPSFLQISSFSGFIIGGMKKKMKCFVILVYHT